MSQEQDKYQDFFANDLTELIQKTDKWVRQGYKILSTEVVRGGSFDFLALRTMYLSSSVDLSKYEGFDNADIGSDKQFTYEKLGYEGIANYSKHITWAKPRGYQPKLSVVREALINAYEVVENWDIKDDNLPNNILKWLDKTLGELDGETKQTNTAIHG